MDLGPPVTSYAEVQRTASQLQGPSLPPSNGKKLQWKLRLGMSENRVPRMMTFILVVFNQVVKVAS